MDPCSGISGNITQYSMQVHTQSSEDTEIVNISGCTAGWCSHSFVPHSNILNGNVPSAYDNVSVAARNVVGIGSTRNCTAQAISELQINSVGNGCYFPPVHENSLKLFQAYLILLLGPYFYLPSETVFMHSQITVGLQVLRKYTRELSCNRLHTICLS